MKMLKTLFLALTFCQRRILYNHSLRSSYNRRYAYQFLGLKVFFTLSVIALLGIMILLLNSSRNVPLEQLNISAEDKASLFSLHNVFLESSSDQQGKDSNILRSLKAKSGISLGEGLFRFNAVDAKFKDGAVFKTNIAFWKTQDRHFWGNEPVHINNAEFDLSAENGFNWQQNRFLLNGYTKILHKKESSFQIEAHKQAIWYHEKRYIDFEGRARATNQNLRAEAEKIRFFIDQNIITMENKIAIYHQDITLTGKYARLHQTEDLLTVCGDARLFRRDQVTVNAVCIDVDLDSQAFHLSNKLPAFLQNS